MDCPICNSVMIKTDYFNKILNEYNWHCSACLSYHIMQEKDLSDYYAKEYHKRFSYNNLLSKIVNRLSLVSNRTIARFRFLTANANITRGASFLEIGGTFGEFYNIAGRKLKPRSYTIIEPDSKFNRNRKHLKFVNAVFEKINIEEYKDTDIVQVFHVFEHIFDIGQFLENISRFKPVIFYFEVPNCENEKVKIDSLINNPHYHHFSLTSLELLFERYSYQKLCLKTIEPLSYHPYKRTKTFKRYLMRIMGRHESFDSNGIYIRGIYQI